MENKLSKEERIKEKELLSNVVTSKMMIAFVALVAAIIALIYFGERYVLPVVAVTVSQIIAGVLTIAALIKYAADVKRGVDNKFKVASSAFLLGICAAALFVTLMYPTIGASRTILATIALTVLFFVYEIYPVDFFICSASVISGCIAAAIVSSQGVNLFKDIVVLIVYGALMAILIGTFAKLMKGGKVKFGARVIKKPFGMLPLAVCISFAVSLIAVIGVLAAGGYLLYFAGAACVVYFVTAIIYTVKMM
ncbi:MAG: hypothetical protein IJC81_03405 [Clostridia bacterium]|nr:hypothetical protein [Clostridia bacterium]